MKAVLPALAAVLSFLPSVALACPYADSAADCGACGGGTSLFGYGAWLLLGLGVGIASVSFERSRPTT